MFAAPRLFGQTMPIQSAGVSGSGNRRQFFSAESACLGKLLAQAQCVVQTRLGSARAFVVQIRLCAAHAFVVQTHPDATLVSVVQTAPGTAHAFAVYTRLLYQNSKDLPFLRKCQRRLSLCRHFFSTSSASVGNFLAQAQPAQIFFSAGSAFVGKLLAQAQPAQAFFKRRLSLHGHFFSPGSACVKNTKWSKVNIASCIHYWSVVLKNLVKKEISQYLLQEGKT